MQLVDLEIAIDHIRQACEDRREEARSPFFFLVGAGISHPPIPLASKIIEHCKATARRYSWASEPPGKQLIDVYSHWFHQAYPQPIQRQRYLRKLIEGQPISPANFRLAHLLLERTITNIVVTTNFDDFLSRALTLFGKSHIVCDHPNTVERIDPERDDIQIVHVHGTYWFYDCCNLREEIEVRSKSSVQTSSSMASLLDRLLSSHSPLVIGYGGWEGDVIMAAVKRRLQSPLPYNLYWFCYRRAEVDSLPDWLKHHQQVYFVVMPQVEPPSRQSIDEMSEAEGSTGQQMEWSPAAEARGFSTKESKQSTLSAHQVLDKFIQTFALNAPELTTDPLGFFSKHLRRSLLEGDIGDRESDIYFISSIIERIERANQKETTIIQKIEMQLEEVRDAMRRSQYSVAVKAAVKIDRGDLTITQLRELMDAMWSAALRLFDNSKEELNGYDLVITIGNMLLGQNIDEPALRERVASAMVNKGITLDALNRGEEAISVYDEVVKRFGEESEPALREQVASAMVNKGITLDALNRGEEAISVYDEVVKRFGEASEPALREQVARAMVSKGITLGALNRGEEAISVYDEVVKRFGEESEPALREQVARAMVNKGITLGALNRGEEEISVYDEVVKRFGEATEPVLREQVARAVEQINKRSA